MASGAYGVEEPEKEMIDVTVNVRLVKRKNTTLGK